MVRTGRLLAVLVLVAGLAACSGAGTDGGSAGGAADGVVAEAEPGDLSRDAAVEDDRQVVVTGAMTIASDDPIATADEVSDVVEGAGGRVDARSQYAGDEGTLSSAYLTVRVPADVLAATIDQLTALGDVEDLRIDRQDVTLQVTDLDARISALRTSIDRLETLMAQATTTADLLEAEKALTERQGELDSLTAQRAYLAEQVDLSTLSISLVATAAVPEPVPGGFWGGVKLGWSALVTALNAAIVLVGALVPWVLVGAAVVGIVLLVRRLVPRRPSRPRPGGVPPRGYYPPPAPPGAQVPAGPAAGGPPPAAVDAPPPRGDVRP